MSDLGPLAVLAGAGYLLYKVATAGGKKPPAGPSKRKPEPKPLDTVPSAEGSSSSATKYCPYCGYYLIGGYCDNCERLC